MGMLAPRRLDVDEDGQSNSLPVGIVDNPCSILDMTDLVFIDPVGTGYSRAAEGVDPKLFYSYEGDIASVSEFIRLYTTRNERWGSPKYVAGESYGTVRAVGVADYLSQRYALGLNGVMLISSINDMGSSMEFAGGDFTYALYLPTYAAIAWYHGVLDEQYQSMALEDYIAEVRDFAGSEYQAALFKGARLADGEREAIAQKVAAYIGYKAEDVICIGLDGNPVLNDTYLIHRSVLDEDGHVVEELYLDEEERLVDTSEGYARISYAYSVEHLAKALDRIEKFVSTL